MRQDMKKQLDVPDTAKGQFEQHHPVAGWHRQAAMLR